MKDNPGRSGASKNWATGFGLCSGVMNLSMTCTTPLLAVISDFIILAPLTVNTCKRSNDVHRFR